MGQSYSQRVLELDNGQTDPTPACRSAAVGCVRASIVYVLHAGVECLLHLLDNCIGARLRLNVLQPSRRHAGLCFACHRNVCY